MRSVTACILGAFLLIISATLALAEETNLSAMITATYPITGKCAPINDEIAFRLPSQTEAEVYFQHCNGFVPGYFIAGEPVYAVPDGPSNEQGQWYRITRDVRCGNEARGRFFIPSPPCPPAPPPQVIVKEVPVEVIREVIKTVEVPGPERIREVAVERPYPVYIPSPPPPPQVIYLPAPVILPGTHHMVGAWAQESYGWVGWAFLPNQPRPKAQVPCQPGTPPSPPPPPPPPPGEQPCPPGNLPPSPPVPPPPCPR